MKHKFFDYINRNALGAKRKLKIIHNILKLNKIKNKMFLDVDDPFLFVYSTEPECEFEGIRIYSIGRNIAFKIQNRIDTHPYGKAYLLDFENIFNTFMSEKGADEEKIGEKVAHTLIDEIKRFFKMSSDAQNKIEKGDDNKLMTRSGGTDYSSSVYSKF
jgi:hypothetical protein